MPFPQKLPDYEVVRDLVKEQGYTHQQVADMYGAHPKSVGRMLQRNAVARGEVKPKWMRLPEDDLVKGLLIYGEVVDFMAGYDMTKSAAARALRVPLPIIDHVLESKDSMIQRNVAYRIVNSVMLHERRFGPPFDHYAQEAI